MPDDQSTLRLFAGYLLPGSNTQEVRPNQQCQDSLPPNKLRECNSEQEPDEPDKNPSASAVLVASRTIHTALHN